MKKFFEENLISKEKVRKLKCEGFKETERGNKIRLATKGRIDNFKINEDEQEYLRYLCEEYISSLIYDATILEVLHRFKNIGLILNDNEKQFVNDNLKEKTEKFQQETKKLLELLE